MGEGTSQLLNGEAIRRSVPNSAFCLGARKEVQLEGRGFLSWVLELLAIVRGWVHWITNQGTWGKSQVALYQNEISQTKAPRAA